jgi:hypothetical protein
MATLARFFLSIPASSAFSENDALAMLEMQGP